MFEQEPWPLAVVHRKFQADVAVFRAWGTLKVMEAPLPGGWVTLHTDDIWLQTQNVMGGGGVIRDGLGRWVCGFPAEFGQGGAFLAELKGLAEGLRLVWHIGSRKVACFVDCMEVVAAVSHTTDAQDSWHTEELVAVRELLARNWEVCE